MTRNSLIATAAALIVLSQMATANAAPILQQISPIPATYVQNTDYTVFGNTGLGNSTSTVSNVSGAGCLVADYAGFAVGSFALIADGGPCSSDAKVLNAFAAGAAAVLIYDDAVGPLPVVSLANQAPGPALFITNNLGGTLLGSVGEIMKIAVTELVAPIAVPIPGTLSLLAGGLLGLLLCRPRAKV